MAAIQLCEGHSEDGFELCLLPVQWAGRVENYPWNVKRRCGMIWRPEPSITPIAWKAAAHL